MLFNRLPLGTGEREQNGIAGARFADAHRDTYS